MAISLKDLPNPGKLKPLSVLALDLSSKGTGWAHSDGRSGTYYFDEGYKETPGKLWDAFYRWLTRQITVHHKGTCCIVYESSMNQRGHAARIINSLVAITELLAFQHQLNIGHYHQSTIKKHATGSGKHPKGQSKAFMLAAAKKHMPHRKWTEQDHDEIDALFLLHLALFDGAFLPQEKSR